MSPMRAGDPAARGLLLLLLFARWTTARECGQAELDARDITGCVSFRHMKYINHGNAVWLGEVGRVRRERRCVTRSVRREDHAKSMAANLCCLLMSACRRSCCSSYVSRKQMDYHW